MLGVRPAASFDLLSRQNECTAQKQFALDFFCVRQKGSLCNRRTEYSGRHGPLGPRRPQICGMHYTSSFLTPHFPAKPALVGSAGVLSLAGPRSKVVERGGRAPGPRRVRSSARDAPRRDLTVRVTPGRCEGVPEPAGRPQLERLFGRAYRERVELGACGSRCVIRCGL